MLAPRRGRGTALADARLGRRLPRPTGRGRRWWGTGTTANAPASSAASDQSAGSCSIENHQTRAGWTRRPSAPPDGPRRRQRRGDRRLVGRPPRPGRPEPPPRLRPPAGSTPARRTRPPMTATARHRLDARPGVDRPERTGRSTGGRAVRAVIWLPGLAVALGAAVATAHGLLRGRRSPPACPAGIAWLYPLITDGLALVAYAATARLHGSARPLRLVGRRPRRRAVRARPGRLPRRRRHPRRLPGAAVRGRRLARRRRRRRRAPALPPRRRHRRPAPPTRRCGRGRAPQRDDRPAACPPRTRPGPDAVQPGVQPALYSTAAVQPDAVQPGRRRPTAPRPARRPRSDTADAGAGEQPASRMNSRRRAGEPAPRDRARAAAVRHAARHGALPDRLRARGARRVSRGTAAAALKALREHPTPLHLVPDTPDPETQP